MAIPLFTREIFSQGGKHLMLLLNIITPGIDINDPVKTTSALLFISNALQCVPLITCEESSTSKNTKKSYDMIDSGYEMYNDESEDEDELCRLNTLEFTEWVIKFLDRVLSIVCLFFFFFKKIKFIIIFFFSFFFWYFFFKFIIYNKFLICIQFI